MIWVACEKCKGKGVELVKPENGDVVPITCTGCQGKKGIQVICDTEGMEDCGPDEEPAG